MKTHKISWLCFFVDSSVQGPKMNINHIIINRKWHTFLQSIGRMYLGLMAGKSVANITKSDKD